MASSLPAVCVRGGLGKGVEPLDDRAAGDGGAPGAFAHPSQVRVGAMSGPKPLPKREAENEEDQRERP